MCSYERTEACAKTADENESCMSDVSKGEKQGIGKI